MKFPVDVLVAVSHSELEQEAQSYMGELLYSNMECPEQLTLPDSTKVDISISSVGLVPLYGSCDTQKVLALFAPADPFTPVALYLLGQWWAVGDILHTADSSRDGLIQVDTLGERIVLYVLNRIVYRVQEMSSDELPFLCHGEQDFAKILWKNGQAVGFYSVKPTGSPCSSFSNRSYPLPVMDSLFVRKCHRGKGLGLRMLEDYVDSFKEDYLGLRYPLTTAMYKVCQCYLRAFPGDSELLWEVDSSRLNQRTSVASRIQNMKEVKGETDITEEENFVGSSSTEAVEEQKNEDESSIAEVESVLLNTTESDESTMEIDKESQPEAVMELNVEESGIDKEAEQESVPEQSDETTPVVEIRSLRSGPKSVTSTPRRRLSAGTRQTTRGNTK
uniref:N-acetyltransferase domain-containing protein n=1 Tax=Periophthalmus magnuspinnatus TaxID=409849 RepID=A0A3B3ZBD9_9GOBI